MVTMVNTMSNETFDEAAVTAKFGVRPNQIVDYLTLIGDSVDNIPGVDKVGPKTAAKLLQQYGRLDELAGARRRDRRGGRREPAQGARLAADRARAADGQARSSQLPIGVADLAHTQPDKPRLAQLFEHLDFQGWRRELGEVQLPVAPQPRARVRNDPARGAAGRRGWHALLQPS